MKKMLVISVFVAACALTGCYLPGPCLQGYGPVETEVRDIDGFYGVVNTGDFEVRVTQADSFGVLVEAQENLMSIIETYVSDGELKIKTRNGTCFKSGAPVVVYVTLPLLEGLRNTGSGQLIADRADGNSFECTNSGSGLVIIDSVYAITAYARNSGSGEIYMEGTIVDEMDISQTGSGNIDAGDIYGANELDVEQTSSGRIFAHLIDGDQVKARLTGSGRVELVGDAVDAEYRLTASGKIDALELAAADVSATNSGSGKIFLNATDYLDATITGSGDIIYFGNPVISVRITGSGDLRPYN